jgi:hypothetical protein
MVRVEETDNGKMKPAGRARGRKGMGERELLKGEFRTGTANFAEMGQAALRRLRR